MKCFWLELTLQLDGKTHAINAELIETAGPCEDGGPGCEIRTQSRARFVVREDYSVVRRMILQNGGKVIASSDIRSEPESTVASA